MRVYYCLSTLHGFNHAHHKGIIKKNFDSNKINKMIRIRLISTNRNKEIKIFKKM